MNSLLRTFSLMAMAASAVAPIALTAADVSVTLSNVHICCNSCVDGVGDAIANVKGVDAKADKVARTIVLTATDKPTLQRGVDAVVAAGYFGVSSDPEIKVQPSVAKDETTQSLKLSGVHLCCNKCVKALNGAVTKVQGVTGTNAVKGATSIEITGNFNGKDVVAALNEAGFAAQAEQ